MTLPHAEIARLRARRRLLRWLACRLAPPRSLQRATDFNAASYWSLTGALAAGVGLGLYWLVVSGNLWQADFTLTVGWAILATFGVVFWIWPFLASYYMYSPLKRLLGTRPRSMVYGAVWHTAAHCALLDGFGADPFASAVCVPVVIGALWGSWLPAAYAREVV